MGYGVNGRRSDSWRALRVSAMPVGVLIDHAIPRERVVMLPRQLQSLVGFSHSPCGCSVDVLNTTASSPRPAWCWQGPNDGGTVHGHALLQRRCGLWPSVCRGAHRVRHGEQGKPGRRSAAQSVPRNSRPHQARGEPQNISLTTLAPERVLAWHAPRRHRHGEPSRIPTACLQTRASFCRRR